MGGPKRVVESEICVEVAVAIQELRMARGLNQRAASRLLGWPQPSLSRIESGTYNTTIRILEHIAKGLNARLEIHFVPLEVDE